jgi:puromycin-sensitive aminopeptidase
VLERYGILNDAHAATVAGTMTAPELLDLTRAYAEEPDSAVWKLLSSVLDELDRLLVGDSERAAFAARVRALTGPALRRLGFTGSDGEDDRTRELRATLLRVAAVLGEDPDAIAEAERLRASDLSAPGTVDPALAGAATLIAASRGGATAFETGWGRYAAAGTPQEEVRELYALGRTTDEASFQRLLELTLSEIRTQNAPYVLRVALTNREFGPLAWEFVRRNWDAINDRFPSNSIVRLLEGIRTLTDPGVAADVQGFFAEHEVRQGSKQLDQHLERQRAGVDLRARQGEALAAALR